MSRSVEPFRIHPALESYVRPQTDEETRLLEESLLAEGCRDPLVIWAEENVLVDGHHRKRLCDKHGIMYSTVFRSFADIDEAKAWMDLNQLGRRNLGREERDELIRRLADRGVKQKEIAAAVGMSKARVSEIVSKSSETELRNNSQSPDLTRTMKMEDEIAALKRKFQDEKIRLEGEVRMLQGKEEGWGKISDDLREKLKAEKANADRQAKELADELRRTQQRARELEERVNAGGVEKVEVEVPVESPEALAEIERLKGEIERVRNEEHSKAAMAFQKQMDDLRAQLDAKETELARAAAEGKDAEKLRREKTRLESEIAEARKQNERGLTKARRVESLREVLRVESVLEESLQVLSEALAAGDVEPTLEQGLERMFTAIGSLADEALDVIQSSREQASNVIRIGGGS